MNKLGSQRIIASLFFVLGLLCAIRLAVHAHYVRLWVLLAAVGVANGVMLWRALRNDDPWRTRDAMWASVVILAISITPFAHLL